MENFLVTYLSHTVLEISMAALESETPSILRGQIPEAFKK